MLYGGVTDLFVASEIVEPRKLRRLTPCFAIIARIRICADDPSPGQGAQRGRGAV